MKKARDILYNLATDKYIGPIPAIGGFFLFIISCIYGLVVRILILFYRLRPYRLKCKVISVGNITLGGTGKTSLVEFIARYLKQEGHKVAILSRGYRRKVSSSSGQESRGSSRLYLGQEGCKIANSDIMGDEPYMLGMNLGDVPVIVDADRVRSGNRAVSDYAVDTVILDDGFQQWRIKKDLEIVTIDACNPFGNRRLIPRGILREPLFSLKRADIFVLTKTNLCYSTKDTREFLELINPNALIVESAHSIIGLYKISQDKEIFNIDMLKEKTVTLFSGIGDPYSFEKLITGAGARIGLCLCFDDHHNYSQNDIEDIISKSKNKNIDTIITTEKDAVKINLSPITYHLSPILVLRIELKIKDEQRLYDRLLKLYSI